MKEQFVPYEIALKLKEKGFDEECLAFYYNNPNLPKLHKGFNLFGNGEDFINKNLKCKNFIMEEGFCNDNYIAAPLWQQVIDWFREKHFIDIMIRQTQKDGTAYYKITKIETEDKIKGYSNFCKTVNIARQAVIEHALTLI